jgi:hypothetical protein
VRLPRVRFTIRKMLMLIAILAIVFRAGQWADDRYGGQTFVTVYYVGDLITPSGQIGSPTRVAELSKQAALLKASVTPDVWWVGTRVVSPFPPGPSLIVRHSQAGHKQVNEWLRQQRKLLEVRNR